MTSPAAEPPPYFDALFDRIAAGDPTATAAFGRHVHWGYWHAPEAADGSAADYARAAEELCRRVCDAAPVRDAMRVLDAGCGFGGTVASLNERFRSLDVTGVNIDRRQLARAAEVVVPTSGNRAAWVEADACALPFADAQFDVVLAVECVFHFPSRAAFFAEAARVLRPGGRLALSDFIPSPEGLPLLRAYDANTQGETLSSYGAVNLLCPEDEYRSVLDEAGFGPARFEDITAHTLPTYPFLKANATRWQEPGRAAAYGRTTKRLEAGSRLGWLRYTIVSCTRQG
jgi:SAM-dependent methyltransferase